MAAMSAALITMAADSTDARRRSTLAALPGLTTKNKPVIDITLDDPQTGAFVPSFTTLEKIEGVVSVKCPINVEFDTLHITFQGTVKTYVEKLATSAPTNPKRQAFHTFLRLSQPLDAIGLPEDKVFRSDKTYKFPFKFVVPERLLPQACAHPVRNSTVSGEHLALPPSLGDPMMAGDGKSLLDDMTPENTRISYGIRIFALKKVEGQSRPRMLFDNIKKIRIIPAVPEAPPLRVPDDNDDDYVLSSTKTLRKGVFKGKLGTMKVDAVQPPPFYLRNPRTADQFPPSAMATVNLRFEPAESSFKPPKLGTLVCRLKVATFYSAVPLDSTPTRSYAFHYDSNRGTYVDTIPLSSRCVESAQWTRHDPSERRDSVMSKSQSTSSMSDTAENSKKKKKDLPDPKTIPFYTASVLLPLALPSTRSWVPTFHSCLISRIYLLDVGLQVSAASSTKVSVSTTSFHLKIPIQVASHGNVDARPEISEEEAASIARREADGYFVPRVINPLMASPESAPEPRPSPPLDLRRGARGSVFTPRWGSLAGDSGAEEGSEGPLPPRYTGYVRSGIVMG